MKGKRILKYKKNGRTHCVVIKKDSTPRDIVMLKKSLGGNSFQIFDHTIVKSHKFYSQYVLEVDKCGYVYLQKTKKGVAKVRNKEISNIKVGIIKNKTHIIKVLNKLIKEDKHNVLKIMADKSRVYNIWKKILLDLGFKVEETYGHYQKRILVISK